MNTCIVIRILYIILFLCLISLIFVQIYMKPSAPPVWTTTNNPELKLGHIVDDMVHFKGETYPKEVPFEAGMTLKPGQETVITLPDGRTHQIIAEEE